MSKTRVAVALGLALILGSAGQLPHPHAAAEVSLHTAHAAQMFHAAVVAEDDVTCPACVLQRLLSQAQAAGVNSLEKPLVRGGVHHSPVLVVGGWCAGPGSPRGPPPTA